MFIYKSIIATVSNDKIESKNSSIPHLAKDRAVIMAPHVLDLAPQNLDIVSVAPKVLLDS